MDTHVLYSLGWHPFFEEHFQTYQEQGFTAGRIAIEHKNLYILLTETGEISGEISGRLQYLTESPSDLPKVGDWVVIQVFEEEQKAIIHAVLPRKTCFSRKVPGKRTEQQIIATNLNQIFIVMGLDQNYNIRRLERYLLLARESSIRPIVILNKKDICPNADERLQEVQKLVDVESAFAISAFDETDIDGLKATIKPGQTIAFVGSSGVGKSSLINALCGNVRQQTQEVREQDARGRHTTTRREMILLEGGGILIDTPGMRELQLWHSESQSEGSVDEIEKLAASCRFSDCTHTHEKGCAVIAALENGEIEQARYESFLKLKRELDYLETQQDQKKMLERKREIKNMHKSWKKDKRKYGYD